jgi:LmbE family N-acetylglucosaminyl deacetylase
MNVVSIMAHQDDEMRCLGTMLKCRLRGDRLSFITLTDGSKGMVQDPGLSRQQASAIRQREMDALTDAAGAIYLNLAEPDEFLYDTPDVRLKLIEAIRQTGAELIFTHYHEDYNLDHVTVNRLVRHCAMQACLPVLPTASPPLKNHPAVFLCEPFGAFDFTPTHYVDIGAVRSEKARLLRCHASQEEAMQAAVGSGLEALCARLEAHRGDLSGCEWAEAFLPMQGRGTIKSYAVLP